MLWFGMPWDETAALRILSARIRDDWQNLPVKKSEILFGTASMSTDTHLSTRLTLDWIAYAVCDQASTMHNRSPCSYPKDPFLLVLEKNERVPLRSSIDRPGEAWALREALLMMSGIIYQSFLKIFEISRKMGGSQKPDGDLQLWMRTGVRTSSNLM